MGGYVGRPRPAPRCECPPPPPTGRCGAGLGWLAGRIDERARELGMSRDEITTAAGFTPAALRRMQDDPMFPFLPGQGLLLERVLEWPPGHVEFLIAEGRDRARLEAVAREDAELAQQIAELTTRRNLPDTQTTSWVDRFEEGAARFLTRVLAGYGAVFLVLLSIALVPLVFFPGTRGVPRGLMIGGDVCARVALGRSEPARLLYTPVSGWR
jgi:hypothetical protein